jgi:chromosome segregation ATPase
LKSQYEQTLSLAQQMESVHNENTRLTKLVHSLTADRDELSNRLEISLRINEALKSKHCTTPEAPYRGAAKLQLALSGESASNLRQIEELSAAVKEASNLVQIERRENSELQELIQSILDAAQSKFGVLFSTAAQLREFLLLPETKNDGASQRRVPAEHEFEWRHVKQRLCAERDARKALKRKLAAAESEQSQQIAKLQTVISDIESRFARLQHAANDPETSQRRILEAAESKIRVYEETVGRLKDELRVQKARNLRLKELQKKQNPLLPELTQLRDELEVARLRAKDQTASIASLRKRKSQLAAKLESAEQQVERLSVNVSELGSVLDQKNQDLASAQAAKTLLEFENESLSEKVDWLQTRLKADRSSFRQAQTAFATIESRAAQADEANRLLQKGFEKQQREIDRLNAQKVQLMALIERFPAALSTIESQLRQDLKEKAALQSQVHELQTENRQPRPPPEPETVPITAWVSADFPSELVHHVMEIAQNSVLRIQAKICHVFSTVAKYYNGKLADRK